MVREIQSTGGTFVSQIIEPTFSCNVKVTPTHSSPTGISQGSDPFIRPVQQTSFTVQFPGSGSSASLHQLISQTQTSIPTTDTQFPGTGSSASQHQPASQTKNIPPTSVTTLPVSGSSASLHQPTSQVHPN